MFGGPIHSDLSFEHPCIDAVEFHELLVGSFLDEASVPAGPIYTAADICADEQYRARDMIQHLPVDGVEVGFPGIVPVLGGSSLPVRSAGPDLGDISPGGSRS